MTVSELIAELMKVPNQNLPVRTEENYLRLGDLLFISIGQKEVKPKPCPFCGSNAGDPIECDNGWYIVCDECGTAGLAYDSKAEAIAAWNRRAE